MTCLWRISGCRELTMTRQRYTAMNVSVKILTLKVAVISGETILQKNTGKLIPPRRKVFNGRDKSISVKSDTDKFKIRRSFTDFRFLFHSTRGTTEFPPTATVKVITYKPSLMYFSVSVTVEKFVGWPIDVCIPRDFKSNFTTCSLNLSKQISLFRASSGRVFAQT